MSLTKLKLPELYVMCWAFAMDTEGRPKSDGKRLREKIVEKYKNNVKVNELKHKNFPLLKEVYVHNDCIVSLMTTSDKDELQCGYFTTRGRFIRYNNDGEPELGKDSTISNLLAGIHSSLDTPFNQLFSYLDQNNRIDLFPHKFQGFEKWLINDDAETVIKR